MLFLLMLNDVNVGSKVTEQKISVYQNLQKLFAINDSKNAMHTQIIASDLSKSAAK